MLDGLVYLTFLLLFRWGPGPHEVLFTILFQGQELEFVIEMAPLDAVPHAVHVFLEQVAHGLWNRTYIYLNGPHVVQIGPKLIDDDDEDDDEHDPHHDHHPEHHHDDDDEEEESEDLNPATRAFRELGLDKLAFSDYSADFPHVPWTLGYIPDVPEDRTFTSTRSTINFRMVRGDKPNMRWKNKGMPALQRLRED
jgi:hypothetical protein